MVQCLAMQEAFAEKFRAALSRRDAAIRDFYDIAYAVGNAGIKPDVDEFIHSGAAAGRHPAQARVTIQGFCGVRFGMGTGTSSQNGLENKRGKRGRSVAKIGDSEKASGLSNGESLDHEDADIHSHRF
jgi:hypothetical protein